MWEGFIKFHYSDDVGLEEESFSIQRYTLPAGAFGVGKSYFMFRRKGFWVVLHMQKPEDVPAYAIWKVLIHEYGIEFRAFMEVLADHSSTLYTFDNPSDSILYITVNKAVNILLESIDGEGFYSIFFARDLHDERITKYITGQTPQQFHFSFHSQR